MDKPLLLQRVASIRARAEAAHLEIVISSELVAQMKKEGGDAADAELQLATWEMTEQKLLRELDWVLDQLDQQATDRLTGGRNFLERYAVGKIWSSTQSRKPPPRQGRP